MDIHPALFAAANLRQIQLLNRVLWVQLGILVAFAALIFSAVFWIALPWVHSFTIMRGVVYIATMLSCLIFLICALFALVGKICSNSVGKDMWLVLLTLIFVICVGLRFDYLDSIGR